jgi:hypothetical protein
MKCRLCENEVPNRGYEEARKAGLCFNCWFWEKRIRENAEMLANPKSPYIPCVVEGKHYCFQPGIFTDKHNCGLGGARFRITIEGREYETNNVWVQGMVPVHFRDRLPDNATMQRL